MAETLLPQNLYWSIREESVPRSRENSISLTNTEERLNSVGTSTSRCFSRECLQAPCCCTADMAEREEGACSQWLLFVLACMWQK